MIRYANISDLDILSKYDKHISKYELNNAINLNRIIVMYENKKFIGWLRYNLFWDNTPFMNMLYFLEGERGKGNGNRKVDVKITHYLGIYVTIIVRVKDCTENEKAIIMGKATQYYETAMRYNGENYKQRDVNRGT